MDAMKIITEGMIKEDRPEFNVGDTVRVSVRIKEGERERIPVSYTHLQRRARKRCWAGSGTCWDADPPKFPARTICCTPVSYTHLDVYKRQAVRRGCQKPEGPHLRVLY